TLEQEYLIGERQRIPVQQIDLHLGGAVFVDQRVDLDVLRLAERVDVVEERIELVDGRNRVRLTSDLGSAGAADRRLERVVGIGIRLDQEELELRRHHGFPAVLRVEVEHVLKDIARRHRHGTPVGIETVVQDLCGRL